MDLDEKNIFEKDSVRIEILRYLSYWPFFLLSLVIFSAITYTYLRYAENIYRSTAKIQIIDKSQDSEMALPTSMTIFNRSMVNLDNELGIISSFPIHKRVVENIDANIKYFSVGRIKTTENHKNEWFDNYEIYFDDSINNIKYNLSYEIYLNNNKMKIIDSSIEDSPKEYNFDSYNTKSKEHDLPFNLNIFSKNENTIQKNLIIYPTIDIVDNYRNRIVYEKVGDESDQIILTMMYPNQLIANDYIDALLNEFNLDGVMDRQLEYKRTIEFVDSRSIFLKAELEIIENQKQDFKEKNNLSDIQSDADINVNQQYTYDSELFNVRSQQDLIELLEKSFMDEKFEIIPVNIGLNDNSLNSLIEQYNILIKERDRFILSAGPNNNIIKNFNTQIKDFYKSIKESIFNYNNSLELKIKNLNAKEKEFENKFGKIPENEKILRSIERELEIKESLFLLLLQKREEASINFAVVKPSIKIIDNARGSNLVVSPNKRNFYLLSLVISFIVPGLIFYLIFFFDDKIYSKAQLEKLVLNKIPVIGEIPFVSDSKEIDGNYINDARKRNPLAESMRILVTNLNFFLFKEKTNDCKTILVTSSIKGEGKTMISIYLSKILSLKFNKVLLIGADLRNPQIHKYFGLKKNLIGLSDYMYKDNLSLKDIKRNMII